MLLATLIDRFTLACGYPEPESLTNDSGSEALRLSHFTFLENLIYLCADSEICMTISGYEMIPALAGCQSEHAVEIRVL